MFSLFKKQEKIYLAGWEVTLNGDELCQHFIQTQITTPDFFDQNSIGLELIFEKKRLVKVYEHSDGEPSERRLSASEIGMLMPGYSPLICYQLFDDEQGKNQVGGEIPADFSLPESGRSVPFQYLGFMSKSDPAFNWLPFDFHLTCPIYLSFEQVLLDYTDPLKPLILNPNDIEIADNPFDGDCEIGEIIFEPTRVNTQPAAGYFMTKGYAGVPNWIQFPQIPVCPKTGRVMKFLCQLNGSGTKTKRSAIAFHDPRYMSDFEDLNFWGDGDLFVFFEPTSKVACYLIQHT